MNHSVIVVAKRRIMLLEKDRYFFLLFFSLSQSLTEDASDEFSVLIMAALFGSYSLIGGLGTTFYVSYFNACLVFILFIVFVVKILHTSDSEFDTIGNMEKMYESISCIKGPDDNVNNR